MYHKLDIYKIIKYYQRNKLEFIDICKKKKSEINFETLDSQIEELKETNAKFNKVCRAKNSDSSIDQKEIRKLKRQYAILASELEEKIANQLLLLPNRVHKDTKDIDIVVFQTEEAKHCGSKKFTRYTEEYCIRTVGKNLILNDELSELSLKLKNFFIESNKKNGFKYIEVPSIASYFDLVSSGHLPKFKDNLFQIDENMFLIPTSETMVLQACLDRFKKQNSDDAVMLCALTPCYRNETAHAAKLNKPLIRQSVFSKVETFIFCKKDEEMKYFDILVENVKTILNKLGVAYRILNVGYNESSDNAYLQYDFEVFLPESKVFVEVASCSTCHDHQLVKTDLKNYDQYVALNCSALPIDRILAVLIEYYGTSTEKINLDYVSLTP